MDAAVLKVITENARVRMIYRTADGDISERVVDIGRIFTHESTGNRLVVGFCHRRHEQRTFNGENILWAMPDTETDVVTFGREAKEKAGRTVLRYEGRTDSASRLEGWA
jgi:predicted DNA-binding transcriptional regulator YafY